MKNRMRRQSYTPIAKQSGFNIVEVIIAMLIITIGLLGLLSMQVYTLKGNQSSYLRSQATILAYELADAMRAQRFEALDGGFDDGAGGYRTNWDARLAATLGGGAAANVVRNDNEVQITINWNDQRGEVVDDAGDVSNDADVGSLTFQTDI
ncbi:type IV pilus modification protein PilV [Marinobacterium iners]|uniref:Type IV pilus assembly protein PilV n=1 Tax=Marinobacterium iners DSM 11526 TaxID=1122198 RepID=A0A1H4BTS4_9GAMM|nr:type IV pilus modification protein PilV [Marinobacterium iners]SEA51531.1 type IV pilus assembly protein PilV [Marinobacterium iners DSM 11526]